MVPIEWIVFLIAFVGSLLKAVYEGKTAKFNLAFIIIMTIAAAIIGVIFGFIFSVILSETFELTGTTFLTYIVNAFIGSIIVPIALYLTSIKLE